MHRLAHLLLPFGAAATVVLLLSAVLVLGGYDAARALQALWAASFGSPAALLSGTLVRAIPLALAGLAVALAFRAGILNIGAEGQLLAGAAAATAAGILLGERAGSVALFALLLAGALAGAVWAGIAALLRVRFQVLEVISTIMLNFVALYTVSWLVRGPLQEPSRVYPQSLPIPDAARLPVVVPGTRLHLGVLLAVAAAIGLWWVVQHTATGFRVRVSGANPQAAHSAGRIDVARTTAGAFLVSGALAGLAGASEVGGVTYALYENLSPGYGYTAIAVALLARLDARWVLFSAVLFGALESGAAGMQRDAGVPAAIVDVVEALLVLLVLALQSRAWLSSRSARVRVVAPDAPLPPAATAG